MIFLCKQKKKIFLKKTLFNYLKVKAREKTGREGDTEKDRDILHLLTYPMIDHKS